MINKTKKEKEQEIIECIGVQDFNSCVSEYLGNITSEEFLIIFSDRKD